MNYKSNPKKRKYFSIKNILIALGIIFLDLFIYFILGMVFLNYEGFYDETKGAYWSLESMNLWEKISYIAWHLWVVFNLIVLAYLAFRMIKYFRLNQKHKSMR